MGGSGLEKRAVIAKESARQSLRPPAFTTMTPTALSRREALRRIAAATAMAAALDLKSFGAAGTAGYGMDPKLTEKEIPWSRILTDDEKKTVAALADVILPADQYGPAASAVGVPDFIDEWVSAPYEAQIADRDIVRPGLAWMDKESAARFAGKRFHELEAGQQTAFLDDIGTKGSAAHKAGYNFFKKFRELAVGGYYSTREGWAAIGYVGNVPIVGDYPGPPPEALKHLGLE